ncbi:MAG: AbrB/MazE/SpoVT family DNA-binding domain-containing protein [Gammaproteobacteria bacterium]
MKTKAQKWGNSLAVRVPRDIVQAAGIHADDALEVEVVGGKIVLTPAAKSAPNRYDLGALVKKIQPRHRYREADFGKPVGREVW